MHKQLAFSITPLLLLLTLSFSVFVFTAGAQETATTSVTEPEVATTTEERGTALEERQEERAELRDQRQSVLSGVRQQRVLNLSANISNRMEAAIDRLFNIVGRLEQRIFKLNSEGINTEAASAKLREAAQQLASARARLGNIDTLVTEATTSQEPKTAWQTVRTVYQQTGTEILASHQALRETISLLKQAIAAGASQPTDTTETASSTSETE